MPDTLTFLATRRSHPPASLRLPAPDPAQMAQLLTLAARVPDHGKLEPWRFIVLSQAAMQRLAPSVAERGTALGIDPEKIEKTRRAYAEGVCAVVVVGSPKASDKIPRYEQDLSAGAVCLSLVNAALASGWGSAWLTGWVMEDRPFVEGTLGLGAQEWVAGIVHIGTPTAQPPERPRPDVAALTTWMND
jgi:nitroreductase